MRRSAAPSQKLRSVLGEQPASTSINENITKRIQSSKSTTIANGARATSDILSLLLSTGSSENVENEPTVAAADETPIQSYEKQENVYDRTYNICWAKKSTKKHKTWEGDGFMYVKNDTATVKDVDGTYLGQLSKLKSVIFEDGQILSLGGKEIQIIEELIGAHLTTSCKNTEVSSPPRKKLKKSSQLSCVRYDLSGGKVVKRNAQPLKNVQHNVLTSIIFPEPSDEHQWKYNSDRLPLTDVKLDVVLMKALRKHQSEGVVFLYRCIMGFWDGAYRGAILADEMGLGKTLQCIALTWTLLKGGPYGGNAVLRNVLIVTPSSLTENWRNEYLKWLGREKIKVFVVDSKRKPKEYANMMGTTPIFVVSYEMLIRYYQDIEGMKFDLLICDEGHRLKNHNIKATQLLNELPIERRIILSGTPIQNDLLEFYTLVNFVNPGVLGDYGHYRKHYEQPIVASRQPEADDETKRLGEARATELNRTSANFILRRTKEVMDKCLPTKTECVVFMQMSDAQKRLYDEQIDVWFEGADGTSPLTTITQLKKICNHPDLVDVDAQQEQVDETVSVKFVAISAILRECEQRKERAVLCSSYTQTLDLLEKLVQQIGLKCVRLDGSTPTNRRMDIVDRFNSQTNCDRPVFLLSSRAGGVGLNLVGASRLVLVDSDWNPATDLQAMARIWRDGQKKSVFLYRLLTTGTIEEKIYQRQLSKVGLSSSVVDPSDSDCMRLSDEDLKDLFSPSDAECLTHRLLDCDCAGDGAVPTASRNEEHARAQAQHTVRDCQLGGLQDADAAAKNGSQLKINQLMQWEHHSRDSLDAQTVQSLGLTDVRDRITFMFVNRRFNAVLS